jgi:hypothetical protein
MMNGKLLVELLDEIDAMSPSEYWALYHESQRLPDFVPPAMDTDDFVSVQYNSIPVTLPNSTFSTETNIAIFLVKETDIVFDGDLLWPMAA